jgi:hypothetical protein
MMDIPKMIIYGIMVLAAVAILYVFLMWINIPIPREVWMVIGIVLFAIFCIWAVKVVRTMNP